MPVVAKLVDQLDKTADSLTEVRVFPLEYADAKEMADVITNVFGGENKNTTQTTNQNRNANRQQNRGPGGFLARMMGGNAAQPSSGSGTQSARQKAESTVLAVPDTRTNSVVVNAAPEILDQIEQVVVALDRNPAKTKQVYVYKVENADPADVATTLEDMFSGTNTAGSRSATSANRSSTTNRTSNTNRNTSSNRNSMSNRSSGSSR